MNYVNVTRAGRSWTATEDKALGRSYPNKSYSTIADLVIFNGKRTIKAIRRRMERTNFSLIG